MPDLDALAPQYAGGLTPLQQQQAAQTQALAKAVAGRSAIGDSSPVPSVAAGIARVLQAGIEGWSARQAAEQQESQRRQALADFLKMGASGGGSIPDGFSLTNDGKTGAASAGGKTATRMPADPDVERRFVGTLRDGGLTNPNGLAAMAAYANAESGYSPSNVTGSWSDPSQSGQPGTSGGILSWRGDRFAKMRAATAGASDPVTAQAKFALTENPDLTMALQNARSPEEAHALMANAWKFAGYNDPSGREYQSRLGSTRAYLGRVTDLGSPPAALAQNDPNSGAPLPPARPPMVSDAPSNGGGTTAEADLPMAGATPVSYSAMGDYTPDESGFIIPGVPTSAGIAAAAPAPTPSIRDALINAANTVGTGDTTGTAPLASTQMGGPAAPMIGVDQGTDPTTSPTMLAPPDAVITGSAAPNTPAAGSFAAPVLPVTDNGSDGTTLPAISVAGSNPPLPPVRPAGLPGSGDVAPSPDWRTVQSPADAPLPPSRVADASGTIVPATPTVSAPTQGQQLARVMMPDLSNSNDAGAGAFARTDGGSNAQAIAALLANSRGGQGGTSGNPQTQALAAAVAGQPIAPAAPLSPVVPPSGPAPGSILSPAPGGPPTQASAAAPPVAAQSSAPPPATWAAYKPDSSADPAVTVPGYDGRTWTRQQALDAYNAKADEYPEPSEIFAAQRGGSAAPGGGPATTGATTPAPQQRGPEGATPAGAPGYTPRALAALSVMANDNAPAGLRQAAQQVFSQEMNNGKGRVVYRDGTAYWLKGDGSAPEEFEKDDSKSKQLIQQEDGSWVVADKSDGSSTPLKNVPVPKGARVWGTTDSDGKIVPTPPGYAPNTPGYYDPKGVPHVGLTSGTDMSVDAKAKQTGAEGAIKALEKSHEGLVQGTFPQLKTLDRLESNLKAGMYTGGGADYAKTIASYLDQLGIGDHAKLANTQEFLNSAAQDYARLARATFPTRVTNTDLDVSKIMAGTDIRQVPEALQNAIDMQRENARMTMAQHNRQVDKFATAFPNQTALSDFYRVDPAEYNLGATTPMGGSAPPQKGSTGAGTTTGGGSPGTGRPQPTAKITVAPSPQAVQALRANPALRDEFDGKYGQGAAAAILGR